MILAILLLYNIRDLTENSAFGFGVLALIELLAEMTVLVTNTIPNWPG